MKKFYVTTPIYYVNDVAHIGHAYTTLAADILARFNRLRGREVFFITGLDENTDKTVLAAQKKGFKDVQKYADSMAGQWISVWKTLGISNNDFIRTTEERHKKNVFAFYDKVWKKGDVYKGVYQGLYCEGCEAFVTQSDLVDGLCPLHKKPPKELKEENYFFKLSQYQDALLKYYEEHPDFIGPETRRNEVISFVKSGLKDISISRPGKGWGIPLPNDSNQVFWVWFDALLNYCASPAKMWPPDVQIMAKDIIRFHCVIWPAMLLSAGYSLPKRVFAHGFLTVEGQKMGKSLGNFVSPLALAEKYSVDALRFFLFREISFKDDGDFSEKALILRHNELADAYGNFVFRTLSFIASKYGGVIPEQGTVSAEDEEFKKRLESFAGKVEEKLDNVALKEALDEIMLFSGECNRYFNNRAPWKLLKEKDASASTVLLQSAKAVYALSVALSPFVPETTTKALACLGLTPEKAKWADYSQVKPGLKLSELEILLEKFEENPVEPEKTKAKNSIGPKRPFSKKPSWKKN